jgi:hypothetical protein
VEPNIRVPMSLENALRLAAGQDVELELAKGIVRRQEMPGEKLESSAVLERSKTRDTRL